MTVDFAVPTLLEESIEKSGDNRTDSVVGFSSRGQVVERQVLGSAETSGLSGFAAIFGLSTAGVGRRIRWRQSLGVVVTATINCIHETIITNLVAA